MKTTTELRTPVTGNFLAMLQQKPSGVALVTLDEKLSELVEAVRASGKKGKLTYTITIKPNAKRGVQLDDEVKVDLPRESSGTSYFFVGEGGQLLKNDPAQLSLELRAVPSDQEQPVKAVAG
jgi:hypothetical protein